MTIGTNVQASSSIFEKELKKQKGDITFPFRNVRDIFLADDMTMVNFEGTLTTAGKNPKNGIIPSFSGPTPATSPCCPQAASTPFPSKTTTPTTWAKKA